MMGKTHLGIGIAASLAVVHPQTKEECLVAIMGGALGGVLADIDILDNDYESDALIGQLLAVLISAAALLADHFWHFGILEYVMLHKMKSIIGGLLFCVLWVCGAASDHRKFTHSLSAMCIYSAAVALIYPPVFQAYIVGYFSHLVLDLLNKKKIQLLYPLKWGMCLNMCYAGKTANKVLMFAGFGASAVMLLERLVSL